MKKDTPRYVVRLKGVLYFKRRGWDTRRFKTQEIGPAFYAEYATILNKTAPTPKAFIASGLVAAYYKSNDFQSLKPRTKQDYRKFLERFRNHAGDLPVKGIKTKHVIAWRDQLAKAETPHYANYFVRVLRILFRFAEQIDEIGKGTNPAAGVKVLKYQKQVRKAWPKELIEAARAARPHSDRTRLLFELLYCTGQRIGDVLTMRWEDIAGDAISVTQNKTDTPLVIPLTEDLKACLRAADRASVFILAKDMTKTKEPGPWAYRSAAQAMMKVRREIGAEAYDIHAIRHTVASEFDDSDLGRSITGHNTPAMFEHYAGAARQKRLAEKAQKERK